MEDYIKIKFYKGKPSWYRTLIVVGLPRSGKTTISNLLGTCKDTEILDEPLDLAILAQKSCAHKKNSIVYNEYKDSFLALIENYVSELALGRIYNFRKSDASCIYKYKTKLHVKKAYRRRRKRDAVQYLNNIKLNLVLALNDVENALKFIEAVVPRPIFIYVKRNPKKLVGEIDQKGWLSDQQLKKQANLLPGYSSIFKHKNLRVFIPYLIKQKNAMAFLKQDIKNRVKIFTSLQDSLLSKNINTVKSKVIKIDYDLFIKDFYNNGLKLLKNLNLTSQKITVSNLQSLSIKNKKVHRHEQ